MKKLLKAISLVMLVLCFPITSSAATSRTPDAYEPNNTKATAYSYSRIPVMNDAISMEGSLYTLGFKTANLTNANDVDWYKVNLTKGDTIFADIRNLGSANYNMVVSYTDANGKERSYTTEEKKFEGKPEKYIDFVAPVTGTYYVKIYSLGDDGTSNYYFYIGPKEDQIFKIRNLHLTGMVLYGTSYRGGYVDMTRFFPETAEIKTFSLSNTISGGKTLPISKRVKVGADTYYSSGTSETISGMSGASLYQLMHISGKSSNGTLCTWSPVANGTFTCDMAPYPGNEVD